MKKTPDHVPPPMSCADADLLRRCLGDQLDEEGEARMEHHVSTCRECQLALESEAGDGSWWQSVRENLTPETSAPGGSAAPATGTPQEQLREVIDYLAPTDDPEMIGRLGHYEVQGLIGRGSTGIVLKALDRRLNRFVAIKLVSPLFQSNGAARRRFEREGRAVAAVSNDHVVPIYAVDEYRGLPYIVMKYIPDLSLQGRLDRDGLLDSCEAARVGFQVASALAAAHAQGVVHRDVKPANVMLEETVDRAMVTDFGLARVADEISMTHSGTIFGTPQFMSPEQARGEAVDLRSDIFSLGSLLYAACTGHAPFRAQTLFGVLHRVCETEPRPIREVNPAIDEGLAALISALMVKRVEDRFQTADEVALALAAKLAYLQNPTGTGRPVRAWLKPEDAVAPRRRESAPSSRRWVVTLLAVVGLSVGAVAVVKTLNAPSRDSALLAISPETRALLTPDGDDTALAGATVQWLHLPDEVGAEPGAAGQGVFQQTTEQVYELNPGDAVELRIERGDVVIVPTKSDESRCALCSASRRAARKMQR